MCYHRDSYECNRIFKLTKMKLLVTEQEAIDHSINLVTHKAVVQELHILRQEGIILNRREDVSALTMDLRKDVQRMLEQSN